MTLYNRMSRHFDWFMGLEINVRTNMMTLRFEMFGFRRIQRCDLIALLICFVMPASPIPLGLAFYNVDFSYVFLVLVCWLGSSVEPWPSLVHPRNIVSNMKKEKRTSLINTLYNWRPIKKTWENKQTSPSREESVGIETGRQPRNHYSRLRRLAIS